MGTTKIEPAPHPRRRGAALLGAIAGALASLLVAAVAPATLTPVRAVVENVTGEDRIAAVTPCAIPAPRFAQRQLGAEWQWSPRGVAVEHMYRTP